MLHRPRLIPCMLLNHGDLVKTVRFKEPNYLGDPINAMKIFNEKCVDELCVQDISASKEGRGPDFDLLRDMAEEAFMPLSYGGGITTVEEAARLFHIGFEKVILNTAFFEHPELITRISERFGAQSVTVSLDVKQDLFKRYRCFTKDGTVSTGQTPQEAAHRAQELGAGEILLNSIDRDGMMQSVAQELTIPLIACGGAKDASDMKKALEEGGAHAVAAGSMFVYWGPLKAVLINAPTEDELYRLGIYRDDQA